MYKKFVKVYNQIMHLPETSWPGILFRIFGTSMLAALLNLSPQAHALHEGLQAVQQALEDQAPRIALHRLDWTLAHEPWRGPDLWRLIGQTALEAGDAQAASEALLLLAQNGQIVPGDWQAMGDAAWQLGDYTQALSSWQRAVESTEAGVDPQTPGVLAARRIVDYYRARNEYSNEVIALRQLIRLHPTQEDQFRLGLLLTLTDPAEAGNVLKAVVEFPTENEPSLPAESAARLSAGVRTALLFDEPAYVTLQCGRLLGAEGQWELAYEAFRQALQLRPDVGPAWAYLAEASQQLEVQNPANSADSALVRRWLDQAYQLDPDSLAVNALFGLYWLRQDVPAQAIPFLHRTASLDPTNPLWQQSLGAALAAGSDLYAAQEAYRRAVEMAPGNADTWRVLAEFHLHYEIQIEEQGLPAAQKALALDSDNPANQDTVGLALLLLGRHEEAESFFQAALALNPDFAPALLHLGGLYLDRGQKVEAETYLERSLVLLGENPATTLAAADLRRLQVWLNQGAFLVEEP